MTHSVQRNTFRIVDGERPNTRQIDRCDSSASPRSQISALSGSDNRSITNPTTRNQSSPAVMQRPPEFRPVMGVVSSDLLGTQVRESLIASYAPFGMAPICVRSPIVSSRPHISAILPLAIRKNPISTTEIRSPVPTVPMNSPV